MERKRFNLYTKGLNLVLPIVAHILVVQDRFDVFLPGKNEQLSPPRLPSLPNNHLVRGIHNGDLHNPWFFADQLLSSAIDNAVDYKMELLALRATGTLFNANFPHESIENGGKGADDADDLQRGEESAEGRRAKQ